MDVLVVNANRCRQPMPVMPFGACLVAEAAERAGHRVRLLDLMFARDPLGALVRELRAHPPRVVGFSVRNIDNNELRTPATFYEELGPLVEAVRTCTRATVVLGGAALAVMPEALLRRTTADYGLVGDGEVLFPRFLSELEAGRKPDGMAGVLHLKDGALKQVPPGWGPLTDGSPAPDFARWLDLGRYRSWMSSTPMQSKRGCPFRCVYCTYARGEGRDYRLYEPESVARAAQALVAQGIEDIEFVDSIFNSPRDHALAVCRALERAGVRARFQSLELNPAFLDDELLRAMERAGFVGIGITAESASDPVLKGLGKSYTAEDVRRGAAAVRRHRLSCCWIFMMGGPGETRKTVEETIRFAETFIRPQDVAFFNPGLRIYPGTELERIARRQGVLTAPPEEMLAPVFYLSPGLDVDWLLARMELAARDHLNFITGDALALPLMQRVLFVSHLLGLRPPLWKHARPIRRLLKALGLYL